MLFYYIALHLSMPSLRTAIICANYQLTSLIILTMYFDFDSGELVHPQAFWAIDFHFGNRSSFGIEAGREKCYTNHVHKFPHRPHICPNIFRKILFCEMLH